MANDNHDGTMGIFFRLTLWLVIPAAGVLAGVCIWAETRGWLYLAQGTYVGIVFLLGLAGLNFWLEYHIKREVRPELETLYQALKYLLLAFMVGIIAVMIVTAGTGRWQQGIVAKSAGTGILFAGGTFAVGVLFGFLFGFPPTPSSSTPQPATQTSGAAPQGQTVQASSGPAASPSPSVFEHTNLREISDWLTKVIVGAGLVDLQRLPAQVQKLAWFMAFYTDPPRSATEYPPQAVALAILGYFSTLGVLFGYVWTRFEYLSTLYPPNRDCEAFERVDRWLKQPPGPNGDSDRAAMTNAIKSASAGAQMGILVKAEQYRSAGTEDANARSLPVFQALVEADSKEGFHRNRGQYALALMARKKEDAEGAKADWKSALDLLNDAIRIRDQSLEPNWHQYEFARAVCRIHLDEQFNQKPPKASTSEMRAAIRADLDKAGDLSPAQKKLIDPDDPTTNEGVTVTWGKLNP